MTQPAPFIVAIVLALSGCKTVVGPTPEPEVRIQQTVVERAVSCVPENLGAPPLYPDTNAALSKAADAAVRYALIQAGRLLRIARLGEVEPVVASCREAAGE